MTTIRRIRPKLPPINIERSPFRSIEDSWTAPASRCNDGHQSCASQARNATRVLLPSTSQHSRCRSRIQHCGSVLELGGYTLSNGDVLCAGTCQIRGPGTISGGGVIGNDKVTVVGTTITGSPSDGVLAINARGHARATIIDSVIRGLLTWRDRSTNAGKRAPLRQIRASRARVAPFARRTRAAIGSRATR
jgi:hypothetical protein